MKHGEKLFVIQENQEIWNAYINNIMDTWEAENKDRLETQVFSDDEKAEKIKKLSGYSEKGKDNLTPYKYEYRRKKMSVQQYKPIILEFEEVIGKSFNNISAEDIVDNETGEVFVAAGEVISEEIAEQIQQLTTSIFSMNFCHNFTCCSMGHSMNISFFLPVFAK